MVLWLTSWHSQLLFSLHHFLLPSDFHFRVCPCNARFPVGNVMVTIILEFSASTWYFYNPFARQWQKDPITVMMYHVIVSICNNLFYWEISTRDVVMTRLITEVYAHLGVYSLIGPPFRYHSKLVKLHTNFKKKCYNLICITGTEMLLESVNIETGTVCFWVLYFFSGLGAIQFSVLPVNALHTSFSWLLKLINNSSRKYKGN